MKKIILYTDGACSGNPGIGGWSAILIFGNVKKEIFGAEKLTTNNRMELLGIINGLKALKQSCIVDVFSDSAYCINAFQNGWIDNWQQNNWKTSTKKDVQNKELWVELLQLAGKHQITWNKVKGHAQDEYNNRCDELARNAILSLKG